MLGLIIGGLISAAIGGLVTYAVSKHNTDTNIEMNRENNQFNAEQAQINRDFTANEAQKARDYETEMSNTAIQRQVDDAKAAGFNANTLLNGISSASTPVAHNAQGYAAQADHFAGAQTKVDLSGLTNLVNCASKVNEFKGLVGKQNVYDATKLMTDARTASKVAKLSKIMAIDDKQVDKLIKSSKSRSNDMMSDLSFLN